MRHPLFFVLLLTGVLGMTGCSTHQPPSELGHAMFQTKGANALRSYLADLDVLLLQYRAKLNKRNPAAYSRKLEPRLVGEIGKKRNTLRLPLVNAVEQPEYKGYLHLAFSPEPVENRNDYLILGIYKMLYYAYERDDFHKVSALQYELARLQEAHKLLQVVQWRIRSARDAQGNYLFLTWQQNWQVELAQRLEGGEPLSAELLNDLRYIRSGEESLLGSSNHSFEALTATMIYIVGDTIKILGGEPTELTTQALTSFLFLL